jgi:hypothetical protein
MPRYKPDKSLSGGITDTGVTLPYRDSTVVDTIVGKRRRAQQVGTGFYEWPLWKAYPTWNQFNELLAKDRKA